MPYLDSREETSHQQGTFRRALYLLRQLAYLKNDSHSSLRICEIQILVVGMSFVGIEWN